jgi:hypothetical protein
VIGFRLERVAGGGYRVAATDDASEPFAELVNADLLGTEGVRELLGIARRVRAGEEPPVEELRNVHELALGQDEVTVTDQYAPDVSARASTAEFVAFLEAILAELERA